MWTPKLRGGYTSNINTTGVANSRFVEKGDFVKIDNITLGYSIDRNYIEKVGLSKLRVFGVVQNAITITKYTGLDPEMESNGMDYNGVPRQLTVTLGLSATF